MCTTIAAQKPILHYLLPPSFFPFACDFLTAFSLFLRIHQKYFKITTEILQKMLCTAKILQKYFKITSKILQSKSVYCKNPALHQFSAAGFRFWLNMRG